MSAENEFDPATIQVGDTVAGMTVTDVDYRNDGYTIVARVKFRGRATVTGRFRHTGDVTEEAGFTAANHMVFMSDLDEASLAALPRMKGDPRAVSFVLTNFVDVAPEAFGPEGSTGTATVVVDEYRIDLEPIDAAFNTATLVEVVEVAVDQP